MRATPFLQIVHISDRHVVDPQHFPHVGTLQKLGKIIKCVDARLHKSYADGLAPNDPEAPEKFQEFVESQTSQHHLWSKHDSWLVDTGDVTTFGDPGSLDRADQQFQRLAVHFNAAVAIYGNHDAWPGRPPRLRDSAAVTSKQCVELKSHGYTIAQAAAPLHLRIPNGPEVQLLTIDTVDHKPRRNIRALGEVEVQQLIDLGQLVDQSNQALPANRRSLRILACHHPVHYPRRPRYSMRISNDKKVALTLDGSTKAAARPHVHIVLGGHTHSLFPELGRLPSCTPLCVHPDLGDHQCQLNVGSLMQIDRYDKRGLWPNQAQFLRFYFTPDPFLIIVARQIAARCPGVKADYGFIEVDPSKCPGVFEERISLAI